ncbi:nuclear pore complex assembly-domain-containing protein [Gorgonomyces haynaldii]|nr:nuclear pore complex assembly-domain-containing protein [Gorgonomyces haynaldii]
MENRLLIPSKEHYEPDGESIGGQFFTHYILKNTERVTSASTWFFYYDQFGVQARPVDGCEEETIGAFEADTLHPKSRLLGCVDCELNGTDYILTLVKSPDGSQQFFLVDPLSLHQTALPFDLGTESITNFATTKIYNDTFRYIIYGQGSFFCIGGIEAEHQTFTELIKSPTSSNSKVTCVYCYVGKEPLFFIGTSRGVVEVWKLGQNFELAFLSKIATPHPAPINSIAFDDAKDPFQKNGLLVIGQNEAEKLITAFTVHNCTQYTLIHQNWSQDIHGTLSILKLARQSDGHNIFMAFQNENGTTDVRVLFWGPNNTQSELLTVPLEFTALDIEPFGSSLAMHILSFGQLTTYFGPTLNITNNIQALDFHINQFAYTPPKRHSIVERRSQDGLLLDLLLGLLGFQPKLVYPPQDIHQLNQFVRMLSSNVELLTKHCIIYYLLKDISQEDAKKYAYTNAMPQSFVLAMDGFWCFDNGQFKQGAHILMDASVDVDWAVQIVSTLCKHQLYDEAFQFVHIKKPHISNDALIPVMTTLAKKDFHLALQLHRRSEKPLFEKLLEECFQPIRQDYIYQLLGTKLNKQEEDILRSFCLSRDEKMIDFLLLYLTQQNRYAQVVELYNVYLKHRSDPTRLALIENIKSLLPPVQRSMFELEVEQKIEIKEPTMLSQIPAVRDTSDEKAILKALAENQIQEIDSANLSFIQHQTADSFEMIVDDPKTPPRTYSPEKQSPFLNPPLIEQRPVIPIASSPSPAKKLQTERDFNMSQIQPDELEESMIEEDARLESILDQPNQSFQQVSFQRTPQKLVLEEVMDEDLESVLDSVQPQISEQQASTIAETSENVENSQVAQVEEQVDPFVIETTEPPTPAPVQPRFVPFVTQRHMVEDSLDLSSIAQQSIQQSLAEETQEYAESAQPSMVVESVQQSFVSESRQQSFVTESRQKSFVTESVEQSFVTESNRTSVVEPKETYVRSISERTRRKLNGPPKDLGRQVESKTPKRTLRKTKSTADAGKTDEEAAERKSLRKTPARMSRTQSAESIPDEQRRITRAMSVEPEARKKTRFSQEPEARKKESVLSDLNDNSQDKPVPERRSTRMQSQEPERRSTRTVSQEPQRPKTPRAQSQEAGEHNLRSRTSIKSLKPEPPTTPTPMRKTQKRTLNPPPKSLRKDASLANPPSGMTTRSRRAQE